MKKTIFTSLVILISIIKSMGQTGTLSGTGISICQTFQFNICSDQNITPLNYGNQTTACPGGGAVLTVAFNNNGTNWRVDANTWNFRSVDGGGTLSGTNPAGAIITVPFYPGDIIRPNNYNTISGVDYVGFTINGVVVPNFNVNRTTFAIRFRNGWDLSGNNNAVNPGVGACQNFIGTRTNHRVVFGTGGTGGNPVERMTILNNSGNVGIGTSAPNNRLEVTHGTSGNSGLRFTNLLSTTVPIANPGTGVLSVNSNGDVVYVNGIGNTTNTCGTINMLPRLTGTNTYGCSQIFDNGTNFVGIGTTTDDSYSRLRISGNNTQALTLNSTSTTGGYGEIRMTVNNSDMRFGVGGDGTTPYGGAAGSGYMGTVSNNHLLIATNNTVRAFVSNNGNIGFGNINPLNRVEITHGTNGNSGLRFTNLTSSSSPIVNPSTGVLSVNANGDVIYVNNVSAGNTTNNCATSNMVPRLTSTNTYSCSQIFDNGTSVGVNTTGPFNYTLTTLPASSGGTVPLTGTVRFDVNGVARFTGFYATSDQTLKTNINSIKNSTDLIKKLEGKTYEWTDEFAKESALDKGTKFGFLAQEVEKVMPEAVIKDENGRYAVEYNAFIPVLVESQKQLIKENEALKAKLSNYDEKFALLEKTIAQLCESGCAGLGKKTDVDALYQSIPNPTDSEALINYYLSREYKDASISIYTQDGKTWKTFPLEGMKGNGSIKVDLRDLSSGTYIYTLVAGERIIDSKKLQIVK